MSHHQNAEKNHKMADKSLESVADLKYLTTTATN
jgi:hypothetical protein